MQDKTKYFTRDSTAKVPIACVQPQNLALKRRRLAKEILARHHAFCALHSKIQLKGTSHEKISGGKSWESSYSEGKRRTRGIYCFAEKNLPLGKRNCMLTGQQRTSKRNGTLGGNIATSSKRRGETAFLLLCLPRVFSVQPEPLRYY